MDDSGYRDHVLTRMLRPALGGNCCTLVLALVLSTTSAAEAADSASASTLAFTARLRAVSCQPRRNILQGDQHSEVVSWMRRENNGVRYELSAAKNQIAVLEKNLGQKSLHDAKVWDLVRELESQREAAAAARTRANALEAELEAARCAARSAAAATAAAEECAAREAAHRAAERRAAAGAEARAAAMEGAVERMARQLADASGMSEVKHSARAPALGRLFGSKVLPADDLRGNGDVPPSLPPLASAPTQVGPVPDDKRGEEAQAPDAEDIRGVGDSPRTEPTPATAPAPKPAPIPNDSAVHDAIARLRHTLDSSLHVAAQQHTVRHMQSVRDPRDSTGAPVDAGAVTHMLNLLLQVAKAASSSHQMFVPEPAAQQTVAVHSSATNVAQTKQNCATPGDHPRVGTSEGALPATDAANPSSPVVTTVDSAFKMEDSDDTMPLETEPQKPKPSDLCSGPPMMDNPLATVFSTDVISPDTVDALAVTAGAHAASTASRCTSAGSLTSQPLSHRSQGGPLNSPPFGTESPKAASSTDAANSGNVNDAEKGKSTSSRLARASKKSPRSGTLSENSTRSLPREFLTKPCPVRTCLCQLSAHCQCSEYHSSSDWRPR
jgi:hypothetical protein